LNKLTGLWQTEELAFRADLRTLNTEKGPKDPLFLITDFSSFQ
jgi:hypothetical protein